MVRYDTILRCMQMLKAIEEQRGEFTVNDLAVHTGMSKRSAYRYFESASMVLPIAEMSPFKRGRHNGEGNIAAKYKLMR